MYFCGRADDLDNDNARIKEIYSRRLSSKVSANEFFFSTNKEQRILELLTVYGVCECNSLVANSNHFLSLSLSLSSLLDDNPRRFAQIFDREKFPDA